MKETSKIIGGLVLTFLLATTGTGLGQETAANQRAFASINITETPVQAEPLSLSASDLPSLRSLSDAQLETFMNALDSTQTGASQSSRARGGNARSLRA